MISFTTYGATLVFYAALFPRIARNTPHARQLKEKYESGEITSTEYEIETSLEKSRISNISNASLILFFYFVCWIIHLFRVIYMPGQ
jgi:hypothetical protein